MLYIVATPIGNHRDITLRALEVLEEVDLILAEDTRKTKALLAKYPKREFKAQILRLDDHVIGIRLANIIDQIKNGLKAALVSNAGTPQVSDPGNLLVMEATRNDIKIIPIPGPSAVTAILSVANFYSQPSVFYGFLPKKKGRESTLLKIKESAGKYGIASIIIFESPQRLIKTLNDLSRFLGENQKVVIGRELTKYFEEIWYGELSLAIKYFQKPQGEFTLLVQVGDR